MKIPTDRKMTFVEFVAYQETLDKTIDDGWLKHWKEHLPKMILEDYHNGDCTNVCCPCSLCTLENWLKEYKEYFFIKEGCGVYVEFWDRFCGQIEDLKHSNHIILCENCKENKKGNEDEEKTN